MTILLVNSSFGYGGSANANLATDLAQSLATEGHSIDVLCIIATGEIHAGISPREMPHVFRLYSWSLMKWLFLLYAVVSLSLIGRRYSHIICMDDPQGASTLIQLLRSIGLIHSKLVLWQLDLSLLQRTPHYERLLGRYAVALLRRLFAFTMNSVDAVVVMGRCMADTLHSIGVTGKHIVPIPPWPALSIGDPHPSHQCFKRFTLLYSGHLGSWHDIEAIQDLLLRSRALDCTFVFRATGVGVPHLKNFVEKHELTNVDFHNLVEHEGVRRSLEKCNAHLVVLRSDMLGISVPSKAYAAMAVSRPVLFIGPQESQVALDIIDSKGGATFDPSHPGDIDAVLTSWVLNPALAVSAGLDGFRWFMVNRDRSVSTRRWSTLLATL